MTSRLFAGLMLLASLYSLPIQAQEDDASKPIPSVQVNGAKDQGEAPFAAIPYAGYIRDYKFLRLALPRNPRLVELWVRVRYPSMSWTQQDDYLPPRDSIAIVSHSARVDVPVRRGGYFILPEVVDAYRDSGDIQFRSTVKRALYLVFSLQIGEDQRIAYAELGKAVHQIDTAKGKISAFNPVLKAAKRERHDAISACFFDTSGAILVDGQPAAARTYGKCKVMPIDPARFSDAGTIEFTGPLDIVTFADRRNYGL